MTTEKRPSSAAPTTSTPASPAALQATSSSTSSRGATAISMSIPARLCPTIPESGRPPFCTPTPTMIPRIPRSVKTLPKRCRATTTIPMPPAGTPLILPVILRARPSTARPSASTASGRRTTTTFRFSIPTGSSCPATIPKIRTPAGKPTWITTGRNAPSAVRSSARQSTPGTAAQPMAAA